MWIKKLVMTKAETLLPERLPHGNGKSFKKGVSDGLLSEDRFSSNLPSGHDLSYRKGVAVGAHLKQMTAKIVAR